MYLYVNWYMYLYVTWNMYLYVNWYMYLYVNFYIVVAYTLCVYLSMCFPRVTAFALRVLNDANDRDWELMFFIENYLLRNAARWLCQRQSTNGAFYETAPLYDRKMWVRKWRELMAWYP